MSIGQRGQGDQPMLSTAQPNSSCKLQVQRSQSQNNITIHFSALGKEDEEESLYDTIENESEEDVTALEAKEHIFYESEINSEGDVASGVLSDESKPLPSISSQHNTLCLEESVAIPVQLGSAMAAEEPSPSNPIQSSPSKSVSLPSMDKAILSIMKSLSIDVEPREGIPAPPSMRHRKLKKGLVKSWSTDTNQDSSGSNRSPESPLQLFRQFTQPRSASAWDSKTAPLSSLISTDNQTYSFKVSEVEARFEDTKRRLSEVISDPLNLFSKLIGDEGTNIYRPKALSSSMSELGSSSTLYDHLEGNKNYSIKEEEDNVEDKHTSGVAELALADDSRTVKPTSSSLDLDKCSMSALAKQEYEEFCELYSDDFDSYTEPDGDCDGINGESNQSVDMVSEDDLDVEPTSSIPYKTLLGLTVMIYGYFVLPFPPYICGMFMGVALGFMLTIGAVWLSGPKQTGKTIRFQKGFWNVAHLDIKEPDVFKGWMNEIQDYDPETYHATMTRSVFVRLEGSMLRLSTPNKNIPRRASYAEPKPDITHISQKIYKLTDSKVFLVPQSLARKRIWNKKYPICIELGKQEDFISKAEGEHSVISEEGEIEEPFVTLYLFGRTGREKEEWFRRILLASKHKSEAPHKVSSLPESKSSLPLSHSSSSGGLDELTVGAKHKPLMDYNTYMAKYMLPQTANSAAASPMQSQHGSPELSKKLPSSPVNEDSSFSWLNAVVGRIAWDFLREKQWVDFVSKKIQMKLSKIRLPYFMNELKLTELDMGHSTPRILTSSQPSVDHQGLWVDLEISYKGSFLMTLETKMNLVRLGKEGEGLGEIGKEGIRPRTYCLADSDEESSSAGSSDEEEMTENVSDKSIPVGAEGYIGIHKPSKIMRFVDKIAKNKYFKKATETEFIKKKMEEVSNTPLLLTVELRECRGILAVNIPPPPTDRIWYGFRSPPHLELRAQPKLGERKVTLAPVTDWIENKLDKEFQKLLVMPNMDDVWLDIMHSATDTRSGTSDAKSGQNASESEIWGSEDA
ncbi:testis-expressed protein 2-like isoform X1 [Triplophysa rosa]|uniref:Testis-expressed sequence 2 protein-like n=1 Tax=Triplophysa rosa TaxID=992332 RepID=A0A9W8C5W3_TRIRA|nr:testis-expressed protein 2-like isoform X1 [Triplophysa rosa]KAI7808017.1 putative testis-expressed sequence 2 protein-like [Triplophysa rosa]